MLQYCKKQPVVYSGLQTELIECAILLQKKVNSMWRSLNRGTTFKSREVIPLFITGETSSGALCLVLGTALEERWTVATRAMALNISAMNSTCSRRLRGHGCAAGSRSTVPGVQRLGAPADATGGVISALWTRWVSSPSMDKIPLMGLIWGTGQVQWGLNWLCRKGRRHPSPIQLNGGQGHGIA